MQISRIEVVCGFELDPAILLTCGQGLKRLSKTLKAEIHQLSVPEQATPSLPRVVLRTKDAIINLALNRIHLQMVPPQHVAGSPGSATKYAEQGANSVLGVLAPSLPAYEWSGVIALIDYPEDPVVSASAIEAATGIFDKMVRLDRAQRRLSAFQLQFGVQEEEYYVTYTIGGFEKREGKVAAPKTGGFLAVDSSELGLESCGPQVRLDLNNKASRRRAGPAGDVHRILDEITVRIPKLGVELGIEELLR